MILIVGATGNLGGMITRRLLAQSRNVRILARPGSKYQPLADAGASPVIGDLRDRASLDVACQGIDTIIATAAARMTEDAVGSRAIELHGYRSLIDAARQAGVQRFIFISSLGADPSSPVPYLAAKGQTADYLRKSGIAYTILEPDWIMDGWFMFFVYGQAVSGQPVWVVGNGDDRHGPLAAQDLAAFAAAAVDYPGARNRTIPLSGPQALSLRDAARLCEGILGCSVALQPFTADQPPPGWPPLLAQLMLASNSDYFVDATQVAREFGVRLISLQEYLETVLASAPLTGFSKE